MFSVLSLAIKARSASGTRVRGVGWLKRKGERLLTVVDRLYPRPIYKR